VVVVDDIEQNVAFRAFARAHPQEPTVVCDADDGRAQFGCLLRARSAPAGAWPESRRPRHRVCARLSAQSLLPR